MNCFSRSIVFFKARKEEEIKPKVSRRKLRAEINENRQVVKKFNEIKNYFLDYTDKN